MANERLTRRRVLGAALASGATAVPFVRAAGAASDAAPAGKMVLAWHTNIATRWLDPQQHDGTASPDNFLMAVQDALIKNCREAHYNYAALASGYELTEDAKTASFKLRPGTTFHDGSAVNPH